MVDQQRQGSKSVCGESIEVQLRDGDLALWKHSQLGISRKVMFEHSVPDEMPCSEPLQPRRYLR